MSDISLANSQQTRYIAIIGGGIMGVSLAYFLAQHGFRVMVFERGKDIGGLASAMPYDGCRIDRFYHTILSSDTSMQTLIEESGVANKLHFTETKQGFYDAGKLYPFNTAADLLRFPPLTLIQRFRLGLQVLYAQLESDWQKMDRVPARDWLSRVSGKGVYEKVWRPLLRAKFDSVSADVPATYIWSRLRRMLGTRQGITSKEMMCYLQGGYITLIEALAARAQEMGVVFHLGSPIERIVISNGRVDGIATTMGVEQFDAVVSTLPSPVLSDLISDAPPEFQNQLADQKYLGVLCPLLILNKSLIPYYVLNITDETIPFTAVVETTNLIAPEHVGGYHLIYLPKYLAPGNPMAEWTDEQVKTEWLKHLHRMFHDFEDSCIVEFIVQRARYVEPLRPMGTLDQIPAIKTPVKHLYMGNTVMIYPELGNGEAVTRFARRIVEQVVADAPTWTPKHAVTAGTHTTA